MKGARHQFFAGAALAEDQHGGVLRRQAGDQLRQLLDERGVAHNAGFAGVEAFPEKLVFILQDSRCRGRFQARLRPAWRPR